MNRRSVFREKNNSIMFRITLQFVVLVILPVFLLFTYNYFQLKNSIEKEAFYEADLYGQQIQNKINLKADLAENTCNSIAYDSQFVDFLKLDKPFDGSLINYYSDRVDDVVSQALLFDKVGIESFYVFMNNPRIPEGWGDFWSFDRIQDKKWCVEFIESGKTDQWFNSKKEDVFDFLYIDYEKPENRYYARRINDINGRCLAVVMLEFNVNDFFLSSVDKATETKKIVIKDEKNNVLTQFVPDQNTQYNFIVQSEYEEQNVSIEVMMSSETGRITFRYGFISSAGIVLALFVSIIILYLSIRNVFKKLNESLEIAEQAMMTEKDLKVPYDSNDELGRIAKNFNSLIEKNRALIKDIVRRETLQKNTQLKALQYQINPHFFYNTLDIISSKMVLSGNVETADVISGFGKMLRYNISSKSMYTNLMAEITYIKQYMAIQKLRFEDRLSLEIHVENKAAGVEILKFILQPIVENSILHGMSDEAVLVITIDAFLNSRQNLEIHVSDNGIGLEDAELEEVNRNLRRSEYSKYETDATHAARGIGLENINERLKIFYGEDYGLRMQKNGEKGVQTIIVIPVS